MTSKISRFLWNRGPRAKIGHPKKNRKTLHLQVFDPPRLAPYLKSNKSLLVLIIHLSYAGGCPPSTMIVIHCCSLSTFFAPFVFGAWCHASSTPRSATLSELTRLPCSAIAKAFSPFAWRLTRSFFSFSRATLSFFQTAGQPFPLRWISHPMWCASRQWHETGHHDRVHLPAPPAMHVCLSVWSTTRPCPILSMWLLGIAHHILLVSDHGWQAHCILERPMQISNVVFFVTWSHISPPLDCWCRHVWLPPVLRRQPSCTP